MTGSAGRLSRRWVLAMFAASGLLATSSLAAGTYVVTKNTDDLLHDLPAPGTLRAAIWITQFFEPPHLIQFAIPGPGVHTITLLHGSLPNIFKQMTIDGYSQPGAHPNTLSTGDDAALLIEINGNGAPNGFWITANACTVKGVVMNGFGSKAIWLQSSDNDVEGNFIGTDPTGTLAHPNGDGVVVEGSNNTIGGWAPAARNIVSGNSGPGIRIINGAFGNAVASNYIGTTAWGDAALPNGGDGIILQGGGLNSVGDSAPGTGNVVAFNAGAGISTDSGTAVTIRANAIFENGDLGIDRGGDGVTFNVSGGALNFPLLSSADSNGGKTVVIGDLNGSGRSNYTVDFFVSPSCDPAAYGEGRTWMGSTAVVTDASGNAHFSVTIAPALAPGESVTTAATLGGSGTSEFSECRLVTGSQPTVTPTVPSPTPTRTATPTRTPTPTPSPTATPHFSRVDGSALRKG